MRRLSLMLCFVIVFLIVFTPAAAQDNTTPEPPPVTSDDLIDAVSRAEEAAAQAERAAQDSRISRDEAANAVNLASDLFGLFEAMSVVIGLVVPILAVIAGLLGFRRLESAQNELVEARERFERDVEQKRIELDALREQLEQTAKLQTAQLGASVQEQRETSARASLALSLLPMGERQYRAQDYTGALDTYQRALDFDPNNPIIHYRMGYVYTQSGELEKAEQFLTRALELDPGLTAAMAALGYVYRRMGDKMNPNVERDLTYNKAEQNLLAALGTSPKLMDEDSESWWGSLGGLYRRRGQTDQAINAYERATEVTPYSSYPFSNLALLYMQTQNRDGMLKTYRRVEQLAFGEIQGEANNYWAHADFITARLALGKYDRIDEIVEMGLEAAPADSPYTLESLIDTLTRLSDVIENDKVPQVLNVIERIRAYKELKESARAAQLSAD
ncbi:MAG: tetratricopeptide repeat protein [Chitinophagaceae bacterium]|nr:tetratricopeptide repeat protein [Anaerolineae bacterium]